MNRLLPLLLLTLPLAAQQQLSMTATTPPGVTPNAFVSGTPGTGTACYWIVTNWVGGSVMSASPACVYNVPATLSSGNYVQITWTAAQFGIGVTYDVLKTTSASGPLPGASTSLTTGSTSLSYQDQGGSLSAYTIAAFPYANIACVWRINNWDYNPPLIETQNCPVTLRARKGTGNQISIGGINDANDNPIIKPCLGPSGSTTSGFEVGADASCSSPGAFDYTGAQLNKVYEYSGVVTLAQINAGIVLVPAQTGRTLKILKFIEQAQGGTFAGCTAVNIDDTTGTPVVAVSTTAATLASGTIVSESTASGVTLTTFGASLTASQGIQVVHTGSACTTATGALFIIMYSINS